MAKVSRHLFTVWGGGEYDETATVRCDLCRARESMNTEYVDGWIARHKCGSTRGGPF